MKTIKNKLILSLTVTLTCFAASVLFLCFSLWHAVIFFAVATVLLLIITQYNYKIYRDAKIIADNPILHVGVASISRGEEKYNNTVDVIVSGFGVLIGGKPYKYGYDGIKLLSVGIDRENVSVSFGGDSGTYNIKILHGFTNTEETEKLAQRFKYETGVSVTVSGW